MKRLTLLLLFVACACFSVVADPIVINSYRFAAATPTPTPPPESSVLVADAGTSAVNGTYTPRGTYNGKTYYNLVGEADSVTDFAIVWVDGVWRALLPGPDEKYEGSDDTEFPWESVWIIGVHSGGDSPPPTVTESP